MVDFATHLPEAGPTHSSESLALVPEPRTHIRRAPDDLFAFGQGRAERFCDPSERSFSHPPAFTAVLRGPDNGGCRPEEYEGVGADRWYRKAVVQEEDAEPAEQARHGRKRSLQQC